MIGRNDINGGGQLDHTDMEEEVRARSQKGEGKESEQLLVFLLASLRSKILRGINMELVS
jgi:hypothetical protein